MNSINIARISNENFNCPKVKPFEVKKYLWMLFFFKFRFKSLSRLTKINITKNSNFRKPFSFLVILFKFTFFKCLVRKAH